MDESACRAVARALSDSQRHELFHSMIFQAAPRFEKQRPLHHSPSYREKRKKRRERGRERESFIRWSFKQHLGSKSDALSIIPPRIERRERREEKEGERERENREREREEREEREREKREREERERRESVCLFVLFVFWALSLTGVAAAQAVCGTHGLPDSSQWCPRGKCGSSPVWSERERDRDIE